MSVAQALAQLNAPVSRLDGMPPSGKAVLIPSVAGALGMAHIPEGSRYLLRVKWSHQVGFLQDVSICLTINISKEFHKHIHKRSHRKDLILDMSKMAAIEYCHSNVCSDCKGQRFGPNERGKIVQCPTCRGYGIKAFSRGQLITRYLKMSHSTFYYAWEPIYKEMLNLLGRWETVGLSAVGHRLTTGTFEPINS